MRLGIISDTHGNTDAIDSILAQEQQASLWLHAGDLAPDAVYLEETYDVPAMKVTGNCDWTGRGVPEETVVEASGHKIFLTHGHIYGARFSVEQIARAAWAADCDIAVYGHTHTAQILRLTDADKVLWLLNPGSASRPRDDMRPSFMTLELEPNSDPLIELYRFEQEKSVWERQAAL